MIKVKEEVQCLKTLHYRMIQEDNANRLRKTNSNMETAIEFTEGTERASIKEKNEQRKESAEGLEEEISSYQQYRRSQGGWY